jgi:hypothetical protein
VTPSFAILHISYNPFLTEFDNYRVPTLLQPPATALHVRQVLTPRLQAPDHALFAPLGNSPTLLAPSHALTRAPWALIHR